MRRALALAAEVLQRSGASAARCCETAAAAATQCRGPAATAGFAAKAGKSGSASAAKTSSSAALAPAAKDWSAVKLPEGCADGLPTTTLPGQAFVGDVRSTSGLGMGDGIDTHTGKWLQKGQKSPMEYIQAAEPIKVHGPVVASHGTDDPALGCPVEYINLRGTSYENPAVCKYTGNKYYSDPETWLAH